MLKLLNESPYCSALYPGWDLDNRHQLTCVVKASFDLDDAGELEVCCEQVAIQEIDQFSGLVNRSSLSAASEIMPFKQGGEILLFGSAQAPSADSIVSEVSVGIDWTDETSWQKTLRVFGPRRWQTFFSDFPSKPGTLTTVPLVYENAFGGYNASKVFQENPAGVGFVRRGQSLKNIPLPQIEMGPLFIRSICDRPTPGGFGPIPFFWRYHVEDKNARYNMAPKDQRFTQTFVGHETVKITGMVPDIPTHETFVFTLPERDFEINLLLDEQPTTQQPLCDTVIINTDTMQMSMIWRVGILWPVNDQRIGKITITQKGK